MREMYSCREHIDVVLDDFVDSFELAPEMEQINSTSDHPCNFCKQNANYRLYSIEQD